MTNYQFGQALIGAASMYQNNLPYVLYTSNSYTSGLFVTVTGSAPAAVPAEAAQLGGSVPGWSRAVPFGR